MTGSDQIAYICTRLLQIGWLCYSVSCKSVLGLRYWLVDSNGALSRWISTRDGRGFQVSASNEGVENQDRDGGRDRWQVVWGFWKLSRSCRCSRSRVEAEWWNMRLAYSCWKSWATSGTLGRIRPFWLARLSMLAWKWLLTFEGYEYCCSPQRIETYKTYIIRTLCLSRIASRYLTSLLFCHMIKPYLNGKYLHSTMPGFTGTLSPCSRVLDD